MKKADNEIKTRIEKLRGLMREQGLNAYIIPTTDFHGSEYVNDYFKAREFMSGFTGSAGTLVVTADEAALWTDGRYFLQAGQQLNGSGIALMRQGEEGVPEIIPWLEQKLGRGAAATAQNKAVAECGRAEEATRTSTMTVGFDGRIVSAEFGAKVAEKFAVKADADLVGEVWTDRPELAGSHVYALNEAVTGESAVSKLARVRAEMEKLGADAHIITSLEEIAWMLNLRGSDIEHTPVFYAFMLVLPESVRLYALADKAEILEALKKEGGLEDAVGQTGQVGSKPAGMASSLQNLEILPYFNVFDDMERLADFGVNRILMDEKNASYRLVSAVPSGIEILNHEDPAMLMKAVKNPVEIEKTRQAHIRDGVAVTKFIKWVKETVHTEKIMCDVSRSSACKWVKDVRTDDCNVPTKLTEIGASDYLSELRREQGAYDESFDTIAAFGSHGAIIHYTATPDTDAPLESCGFLLVDSGGQYADGTTDITRTIALGPLTDEMKKCYTAVLKAHIALATAEFTESTTGTELDEVAREQVKAYGYDYKHGTGHGIGHMLSVHEGPNTISPRGKNSHMLPGMITSNEPGIYLEGKFGIRLENEILCVEKGASRSTDSSVNGTVDATGGESDSGSTERRLGFETITFVPFERETIVTEMLTENERAWINDYHALVYERLSPLLAEGEQRWLKEVTMEL